MFVWFCFSGLSDEQSLIGEEPSDAETLGSESSDSEFLEDDAEQSCATEEELGEEEEYQGKECEEEESEKIDFIEISEDEETYIRPPNLPLELYCDITVKKEKLDDSPIRTKQRINNDKEKDRSGLVHIATPGSLREQKNRFRSASDDTVDGCFLEKSEYRSPDSPTESEETPWLDQSFQPIVNSTMIKKEPIDNSPMKSSKDNPVRETKQQGGSHTLKQQAVSGEPRRLIPKRQVLKNWVRHIYLI